MVHAELTIIYLIAGAIAWTHVTPYGRELSNTVLHTWCVTRRRAIHLVCHQVTK